MKIFILLAVLAVTIYFSVAKLNKKDNKQVKLQSVSLLAFAFVLQTWHYALIAGGAVVVIAIIIAVAVGKKKKQNKHTEKTYSVKEDDNSQIVAVEEIQAEPTENEYEQSVATTADVEEYTEQETEQDVEPTEVVEDEVVEETEETEPTAEVVEEVVEPTTETFEKTETEPDMEVQEEVAEHTEPATEQVVEVEPIVDIEEVVEPTVEVVEEQMDEPVEDVVTEQVEAVETVEEVVEPTAEVVEETVPVVEVQEEVTEHTEPIVEEVVAEQTVEEVVEPTVEKQVETVAVKTEQQEEKKPFDFGKKKESKQKKANTNENDDTLVRYNKSFTAKLILGEDENMERYNTVKNTLMSYEGVRSRMSWVNDTFRYKRQPVAKLAIRGKSMTLYVALNPQDYIDAPYTVDDASDIKRYKDFPCAVKLKGPRIVNFALTMVKERLAQLETTVNENYQEQDFTFPVRPFTQLIDEKLIKEIIVYQGTSGKKRLASSSELLLKRVEVDEADELIEDEVAVTLVEKRQADPTQKRESAGKKEIVNIGTLTNHYNDGDVVSLETLKEKKLVSADAERVKILADGYLDKKLTVEANDFSIPAIKMIVLTGGKAIEVD